PGVALQVLLRHTGAVGDPDQVEARAAERLAERLQVAHRGARRIVARVGFRLETDEAGARLLAEARQVEVGELVLLPLHLAVERVRAARAALVEEEHVAALAGRCERWGDL